MLFPKKIEIIEVGPRDGLQNESLPIAIEKKKELIARLAYVGFSRMETAAFVHPKWVPQMADSEEIAKYCHELGIQYIALTPNMKALERAISVKASQIAVFIGASSAFNMRNINKTTSQALRECEPMFVKAKREGIFIRAYISTAFDCPYQGKVSFQDVKNVCEHFIKLGADEIDIGDTTGKGDPKTVYKRFAKLRECYPETTFVAHFHDTEKMALANVVAAMQAGITKFDSSIGGLGGCPYSPGATGNVATEDLVNMLMKMECETGIDCNKLVDTIPFAKSLSSRV